MKTATAILALVMLAGCGPAPLWGSLRVYTDHREGGYGCEYLMTAGGGITPRLNPDGTQVCEEQTP